MDLPSTRENAVKVKSKRFFTGEPCLYGHLAPRYTLSWSCCECRRISKNKYRARNVERLRAQDREYARLNADKRKEYAFNNAEKIKITSKRHASLHPEKQLARSSLRRAIKRQAVPRWLTKEQRGEIAKIYALSQWMSSVTGEDFHVDHIYPLTSDFMCGLHVPFNLVVLSASDNIKKSNTWWPGQLDCQKGQGTNHNWWQNLQEIKENLI